jgi:nucleotide-binding universal stress UspA family protein
MYDDILLPFDGSDGAMTVLYHVAEIANWADATIQLLYVADTTRESVTVVETEVVDALEEKGEMVLEDAEETLSTLDVDYRSDVVQGNPAPTIVEYAEQYDQDMVVISTHGQEGLSRYLIGSVTEKVLRLSSIPVLTARMQPDEQLEFPYEDILIPTDGSAGAAYAAQHGISLAASLDATVHALSVVEDSPLGIDVLSTLSGQDSEDASTDAVDDIIEEAEAQGVTNTERYVEHGTPLSEILDCIEAQGIDTVVMGTTGKRETDQRSLGGVTEKTVRSAPVPVITVRKGD